MASAHVCVCVCVPQLAVGLGLWQLSLLFNQPTVARFKLNSPITGNPYLVIAILW